jgi:hypothetical protein
MKRVLLGVILGLLGALVLNEVIQRANRQSSGEEPAPPATAPTHS